MQGKAAAAGLPAELVERVLTLVQIARLPRVPCTLELVFGADGGLRRDHVKYDLRGDDAVEALARAVGVLRD